MIPKKNPGPVRKPNRADQRRGVAHRNESEDRDAVRKLLLPVTGTAPAEDAVASGALSELTAAAKKKAAREQILSSVPDSSLFTRYLSSTAFKVRKNAARLLGELAIPGTAVALMEALNRESVLMTVPSMLLALGNFPAKEAQAAVEGYAVPEAKDETEQKNVAEIAAAKKAALDRFAADIPFAQMTRFSVPTKVLLTAPMGFSGILYEELVSLGLYPEQTADGCFLTAERLAPLFNAHCYGELLIPVAKNVPVDAASIAKAFGSAPELPYRIELRNYEGDRAALIRAISDALGGRDNPSHYATELRVTVNGGVCTLFKKPVNYEDKRFPWRKETVSAAIRPETAACLIRWARKNAKTLCENPAVLDPFAGSGTFLFEREALGPCRSLTGVDITENARRIAMGNAYAGHSSARFIQKDCLRFEVREPADELYANLPFGNRVGTHGENERLYAAFVQKLPSLLSTTGFAMLYTADFRLLEKCLKAEPGLTLLAKTETDAGGLIPHAYLVTRA